ncbi:preprotein translocase subunit YajC [Priestia flexa]|nr:MULTISPECIES: preprotein translocase subunit YajC [Bacillaceae]OZT12093.1 preprotein translocase subunit YajC [Priestia aryabhattai]USY54593.1 preprotein translocase subunit YajC [Bacillus sp. 1780r2a1]AQX53633.1 preprotein translocase subunit YajC [Priestia flexa]KZB92753.1 preprotein translocase subunit YajC [Bacillus sp. VT 712]MBN8250535.1 preprotein translocase subunit YajC [Priestia flexa]
MEIFQAIWPLLLMFAIFYFLLIRPQQKRQKAVQQMQSELKKGDKVITIGGMHALVEAIDEGTVIVKTTDGSKMVFDRAAIREIRSEA